MKLFRWLILVFVLIVGLGAAWFFWQAPAKIEMARLVPAETLVYLEANDLPEVLKGLTDTNGWRELAPQYNVSQNIGEFGWLSRFLATANLGAAKNAIFGRSQVAAALLGFETSDGGEALKIKPLYALVIETKGWTSRAESFVENDLSDFANRQFGDVRAEKYEKDGALWRVFHSQKDARKIYAVVSGSIIYVGNNDNSVQACLDVKNGKRKSLQENDNLREMRARTEAETALAFGFVSSEGVKKLAEVASIFFAGQISEEPAAMSLIAQSLPPLVEKSVTALGWSARNTEGKIEDRYFVMLPADIVSRLREPLAFAGETNIGGAEFLPPETNSVTVYNLKNPGAAWRSVILAFAAKLDTFAAAAFSQASHNLLQPYGIAEPNNFLSASGGKIITARLSEEENETVALAAVGDANKMQAALESKQTDSKRDSFLANDLLLLGEKDDLEKCLNAEKEKRNLAATEIWRSFVETKFSLNPPQVKTLGRDAESAPRFIRLFADKKTTNANSAENKAAWAYFVSETHLRDGGFERRTRSAFGLIGWLAANFAGG